MTSCHNYEPDSEQKAEFVNGVQESVLSFSSKEDIAAAVNSDESPLTRATIESYIEPDITIMPGTPGFLSLMDKVLPDDPLLDGISQEERDIILGEEMTYYEMYGCRDYIPSENFAKLLNSRREIQLRDSVYRITEFGTLKANIEDRSQLDIVYEKLRADVLPSMEEDAPFIISDNVEVHPLTDVECREIVETRTTASDLPLNSFKHYTSEHKTLLGKWLSKVFGENATKHHEFKKGYRVDGSLYSYNYLVYYEAGTFVSMNKKRGGFFKLINGWKEIKADELFLQFRSIGIEYDIKCKMPFMPVPADAKPEIMGFSSFKYQGFDNEIRNAVDVVAYGETSEETIYSLAGLKYQELYIKLRNMVCNPQMLDNHYGYMGRIPAVRILTPKKVYVIVLEDTCNKKNVEQIRKTFKAGSAIEIFVKNSSYNAQDILKFLNGLKEMPYARVFGGEVLLAGKDGKQWGGMFIKKKTDAPKPIIWR